MCLILTFVGIIIDFLILPKLASLVGGALLYGLFFSLAYRGYNWSRICLSILLCLSGIGGVIGGTMLYLEAPRPDAILITTLLIISIGLMYLLIGLVLLFNRSIRTFVNRGSLQSTHAVSSTNN